MVEPRCGGLASPSIAAVIRWTPRLAAASTGGYVVVGSGAAPLRQNPVMWDSDGATKLESESAPFLAQGGSATALCPEYTGELLDMLMNSGLAYATCRGNNPMAFRAYAVPCDGCGRVPSAAQNDASWLAQPDPSRLLYLAPIDTGDWGSLEGVLAPGFRAARGWENHWVTVTGHFDDPASSSCRIAPEYFDLYPGRAQIIRDCRSRFVVTNVEVEG